ncbi:adenine deaminase [Rhizobium laguerreae]|uniref:Adenine deaminase n=1 Tax=Rhizobium laguerreae TaxID=1076926 RepID=A0AB35FE59_9HYPH|nr:adenine deaminase C-terminal domain-containing protein [Rhizobium laguerreae]MBY3064547.1 adenine deaminase [Rhizobium laguerreae]
MKVASGEADPDLVIVGGTVANVLSGEFHRGDVLIKRGRIASIVEGDRKGGYGDARIIDATDRYLVPGLIDPHMHLESSSLLPDEFAKAIVSRGVTTIAIDPHEFGNIVGLAGVEALMQATKGLPVRVLLRVPARVPELSAELETPGHTIDDAGTETMLLWPEAACLAGDISPTFVLRRDDMQLRRMQLAYDLGRYVSGYVPQLPIGDVDTMVAAGVRDSHVPKTINELVSNLRHGLYALLTPRPGRFEADCFAELGDLVRKRAIDSRRICLCTDDVLVHELISDGHLDARLRLALKMEVPPMAALQMATVNTASLLGRDDIGAIAPGRVADVAIVSDLHNFVVERVLYSGDLVAENGHCVADVPRHEMPAFARHTILSDMPASSRALMIDAPVGNTSAKCNVLVYSHPKVLETHDLAIRDGILQPDTSSDILAVAVVERYHNSGRIGRGFVKGMGLKRGALASSTNHNNHHVFAVGASYADMKLALDELKRMQGGYVAVLDGAVIASVHFPVIGMISDLPARELAREVERFEAAMVGQLGCTIAKRPMYALNFLCSPVVMNYGITDLGLVNSLHMHRVPLLAE